MGNELLNEFGNSNKKINSTLDTYSIDELVNLYITYSHAKYFAEHENMEEILNYISSYIIKNISKLSFLEMMNLYSKLAVKEKDIEKLIKNNRNIANGILYESKRRFLLESNAKAKGVDVDKYIDNRNKELEVCEQFEVQWTPIYSLIDVFKNDILSCLNIYVCSGSTDKEALLQEIRNVVEDNSRRIKEGIQLRCDKKKIALHSRFKDIKEMSEVYDKMDTSQLEEQNNVYLNFIDVLKHLSNGNSK